ncbi:hypothetical protein [Sulfurimonas sp. HSL3-7]|uniref:hypothetical protein n=1 Tax=Sulfonitrofixus jiaomeiensis TaxID=3131938 RepID=UPI0031F95623
MKTFIFSTLIAFMLAGCQVTYDSYSDRDSLYVDGSYGWVVQEYELPYSYDYYLDDSLYFETPYLQDGTKVYIDIYNDYGYAYIDVNDWSMILIDQWFDGAYEAHYVFEVGESGYHYFQIGDLDPDTVVHIYYQ